MSKILGSVPENFSKLGKIYGPGLLPSVVLMFELGLDKKIITKISLFSISKLSMAMAANKSRFCVRSKLP